MLTTNNKFRAIVALGAVGAILAFGAAATAVPLPPPGAPALSALTLSPTTFLAAPSGASIGRLLYGTTVSYRDSQAATTTFTVLQRRPGVRRTVAVGSFTHRDTAGSNSFRFTGRVNGHALSPGRYALRASASVGNLSSIPIEQGFRIAKPEKPVPTPPNRNGTYHVTVTGYDRLKYTNECDGPFSCGNVDGSVTWVTTFKNVRVQLARLGRRVIVTSSAPLGSVRGTVTYDSTLQTFPCQADVAFPPTPERMYFGPATIGPSLALHSYIPTDAALNALNAFLHKVCNTNGGGLSVGPSGVSNFQQGGTAWDQNGALLQAGFDHTARAGSIIAALRRRAGFAMDSGLVSTPESCTGSPGNPCSGLFETRVTVRFDPT